MPNLAIDLTGGKDEDDTYIFQGTLVEGTNFETGDVPDGKRASGKAQLVTYDNNVIKLTNGKVTTNNLTYRTSTTDNVVSVYNFGNAVTFTLSSCWGDNQPANGETAESNIESALPYAMRFTPSIEGQPMKVAKDTLYAVECEDVKFFRTTADNQHVILVDHLPFGQVSATTSPEGVPKDSIPVEEYQNKAKDSHSTNRSIRVAIKSNIDGKWYIGKTLLECV